MAAQRSGDDDVGQWQDHLDVGVLFGGVPLVRNKRARSLERITRRSLLDRFGKVCTFGFRRRRARKSLAYVGGTQADQFVISEPKYRQSASSEKNSAVTPQ